MTALVTIENNEALASTLVIAKGFEVDHKSVVQLVRKYEKELKSHCITAFGMRLLKNKKGRNTEYFLLNESQTIFLVSLMRNTKIVVAFKSKLAKDFIKQKKVLANIASNLKNDEWKQLRENGKLARSEETDIIKRFVEYATKQGSKNSKHYYSNITSMENKALFFLEMKFKNIRDILTGQQLGVISTADQIIKKALIGGMENNLNYKEIYQLAKSNINSFADIIGKSKIPVIKQLS